MPKKELVDIAAEMKRETDKAFQIFDGARTEWVPKSQVEKNDDGTFTMPDSIASMSEKSLTVRGKMKPSA